MALAPPVQRIRTMDILRGIAVLGILFANITAFSEPVMRAQMPMETWGLTLDEQWAHAIREVLISGKMRSLLAILFGVGLWMQFAKRKVLEDKVQAESTPYPRAYPRTEPQVRKPWPGTYLKRTLLLAGIGLCHGLFIWFGDILFTYALCALLAMVFVRLEDKVLLWISVGAIGFGVLSGIVLAIVMAVSAGAPDSAEMWRTLPVIGLNAEIAAYTSGSYFSQTLHRLAILVMNGFNLFFIAPPIFGLFLLGFLLGKRGVFVGREGSEQDVKRLMTLGLGIGVPLNLLPLLAQSIGKPGLFTMAIELGFAPILGIGLLGVCLKVIPALPGLLTDPFRRVGKVALSVYILQSLLATALFYSWGFRFYDKLQWQGQLTAVLAILAICLASANVYTRFFSIGPVEWLWRSLSEGKRLPWREPSASSA